MLSIQKVLEITANNRSISIEEAYDLKLISDVADEVLLHEIKEDEINDDKYFNVYNHYLKEIQKYPLLTSKEEKELFDRYKKGDKLVKEKILSSNLALVVHIANMFISPKDNPSFNIMDVIQEGNMGLMKAVDSFDPDRGCKFSTFAFIWIKEYIMRSLITYGKMIRFPEHKEHQYRKFKFFIEQYLNNEGKRPSDEILMKEFNLSKSDLYTLYILESYVLSFDSFSSELDISIYDYIKDDSISIEDMVEGKIITEELFEFAKRKNSERNLEIFKHRKGIDGNILDAKEVKTAAELANVYNVSSSKIKQLEDKVTKKLQFAYIRKFK